MIVGIQFFGIAFGLVMSYFTYLYYKRKEISIRALAFWNMIWVGFVTIILIPGIINKILLSIGFTGVVQFLTVIGFLLLFVLIFYMHKKINKNQKKLEKIVKKLALK